MAGAALAAPVLAIGAATAPAPSAPAQAPRNRPPRHEERHLAQVTITAHRLRLLGTAVTASEGVISNHEIQLAPVYRPGQLLETVPGLIVTSHSGEGKANQYLMRGYNLDHGTDLATFVDGMPINQPTHAHGQGYTDLNFLIPELVDRIGYTKGPYYADVGDFGSVGSVRLDYRDTVPEEVSVGGGTFGFERIFAAGSTALGGGNLLGAVESQHYGSPFDNPDDQRKQNAVLRYSEGDADEGYSLTGMYYHDLWNNTTDIPERAISEGVVPDRFGTLDPTDGGRAQRASFSARYHRTLGGGRLAAAGYLIHNQLHLYNDFTHFLVDPTYGDQEDQFENRQALGGTVDYTLPLPLGPFKNTLAVGLLTRYDAVRVGRLPSADRIPLSAQEDPPSFSDLDQAYLFSGAAYLSATTHWTSRLRSVLGMRVDHQHGTDIDYLAALHETDGYTNGGVAAQTLAQPKASLILTATRTLELYLSGGEGFHSADIRGVNQDKSVDLGLPHTPLLAAQWGEEAGLRAHPRPSFAVTLALYTLWQQSETILDPDVGQDSAGPPSRRYGLELNITYQIRRWLELYASYSAGHTRFTRPFNDGTGHLGTYIADAPAATGDLALYLIDLGPWSGGLEYRYLGKYPLSSGPCVNSAARADFPGVASSCADAPTAPGEVWGEGFGELDLMSRYGLRCGWSLSAGIYNLLDTRAPAAEFWYVDRLQSEIAEYPDGRADIHEHPLEPLMARITVSKVFGR